MNKTANVIVIFDVHLFVLQIPKINASDLHVLSDSVQVVCRWVEELRDRLRRFCSESLPLFFLIMWVVVVGVVGSAVIIKILDLLFPTCEHKAFFQLNPETLMPEEEKQSLIENVELEVEEPEKSPEKGELY
ncbi:glycoprotein integral membrane protein 1 [Clarias gariepinus]